MDAEGNPVPDIEVASAAVVGGDTDAPTILNIVGTIIPGDGALEKDIIVIDFSEAVVPDVAWAVGAQLTITGADLTGTPTFDPTDGITHTLTITLDTNKNLTPGAPLKVTPLLNKVEDLAGNKMSDLLARSGVVGGSYAIDLHLSWNLISLPLVPAPTESDIEDVLADLINAGTVLQVRAYNNSDGSFSIWASTGPFALGHTLHEMKDGRGYWIEMSTGDTLVAIGSELPAPPLSPPTYSVYEGWNLIGFKSLSPNITATMYLDELSPLMQAMYTYNAEQQRYTVVELDEELIPGEGYWLAVSADGTIFP